MNSWTWLDSLIEAAAKVTYKDWEVFVGVDAYGVPYLQLRFVDGGQKQYCRKWLVYRSMNSSELVRTVWMAILAAEEHEARERFRYRGVRVMTPHVDFDKLAETGLPVAVTGDPT